MIDNLLIKSDYEAGMSTAQIAIKYDLNHALVTKILVDEGVYMSTYISKKYYPYRKRIKLPVKEIKSEYLSGASIGELAEKHNVSTTTIVKRLKSATTITATYLPVLKVWFDHCKGVPLSVLAKQYKTSVNKLRDRLIEEGIEPDKLNALRVNKDNRISNRDKRYINLPVDQIISEFQSDMSIPQLAEKYGVSKDTIRNRLSEAGINPRKVFPNSLTSKLDLPVDQIASDYQSGMSTYQLAEKYNVSRSTIRTRLKEAGIKTRGKHKRKTRETSVVENPVVLPVAQIWFEYESGTPLRSLAKKYGSDEPTIFKAIHFLQ